eukprot:Gb_39308 [translate_table: standard]
MDFDEYDYLEKTVENPDAGKIAGNGQIDMLEGKDVKDRSKISKRRSDEDGYDHEYGSKRMRSQEELKDRSDRERDRGRERASRDRSEKEQSRRGSSHQRSPYHISRDSKRIENERDRSNRDRPERSERDRERERDRGRGRGEKDGREREKEEPGNDRERRGERDREKIRDRERERGMSHRSSSVSHRIPDHEGGREHHQEKSKDIVLKDKERERDLKDRDHRRFKDRKEEAVEPEADPERDQRTVFAYQISLKADERDVYEFFSRAGKVRDVRLIMDRNSRRSKGVGYIEFYDAMSVPMAIALSGQLLLGQPIMVKPSEAEKNVAQANAAAVGGSGGFNGGYTGGARRLYVGNLHFNITEDQLRQVFEPFGQVELLQLPTDPESGQCKGFGFVQFARLEDARAAQSLNGQLEIAGRVIKVSAVSDQAGMQELGQSAGDFDDDEGGGMTLNARSRAILMQKLDRSGTATSVAGSVTAAPTNPALNLLGPTFPGASPTATPLVPTPQLGQTAVHGLPGLYGAGAVAPIAQPVMEPIGAPSECLMLKNMFDPAIETEPDFDLDIKEDVQEECSKFGAVKHIFVDKNSAGHVFLRFDSAKSAIGAQRALHGRWFAGKSITAIFMLVSSYEARFPESR